SIIPNTHLSPESTQMARCRTPLCTPVAGDRHHRAERLLVADLRVDRRRRTSRGVGSQQVKSAPVTSCISARMHEAGEGEAGVFAKGVRADVSLSRREAQFTVKIFFRLDTSVYVCLRSFSRCRTGASGVGRPLLLIVDDMPAANVTRPRPVPAC